MKDRHDIQTWLTDVTVRPDGQTWRTVVIDRRDGVTWRTDVTEESRHGQAAGLVRQWIWTVPTIKQPIRWVLLERNQSQSWKYSAARPTPTTPLVVEVQEQKGQFHMKILKNGGILNFTIFLGHLVHPVLYTLYLLHYYLNNILPLWF